MSVEIDPAIDVLIGCTAVGKTAVAIELARRTKAEILSVDSMLIYRGMDIGTGKPSPEQRQAVRHHLIDIREPHESFSVADYVELADAAIDDIQARGRRVLAVGGTALYLKALLYGLFEGPSRDAALRQRIRARAASEGVEALHAELARVDPAAAQRIHPNDLRRIERALEVYHVTGQPISEHQQQWDRPEPRYRFRIFGLQREREDLHHRINRRVAEMIAAGWVDELRALLARPQAMSQQASQALGYGILAEHLAGRLTLEEAVEQIKIATRQFAKAQRTWFRRFSPVTWIDVSPDDPADRVAQRILARR
jgi:tRNA dimethylallyltransferase